MPLPQVNDRLKEIPAQALRTLFASVGQLLLAADRLRARATEQLSGDGEATDAAPAQQARPAQQPPAQTSPAKPAQEAAQDAGTARWRSLDKTGNVRLLDGDEEQDEDELSPASALAGTPDRATSFQEPPATAAAAEALPPAPAEPAVSAAPTEDALPPAPAEPALPPAPAEPVLPPAPAGEVLPVPHYDQLSLASLRARLRVLDATQVHVLLDYEKAHEGRPAVVTMFERRLAKLSDGS